MSATVNIGTLEGLLRWKADDAALNKSLDEVAKKADVSKKQLNQYNKEINSLTASYNRVAASLDPVTANTQKYERAEKSLTAALKAGIITQEQHNRTLAQAKEKYLSSSASTLTWREEIQRLTAVISPFATRLADISVIAKEVQGALFGSSAAAKSAAGSANAATVSFTALYAAAAPIVAILAAIAVAAGAAFAAFKGFSFLSSVVKDGTQTQLVIERLNNTLQSTGAYAQMSSAQLVTLAESYELLSGKSKEQIIAAETILARFETLNSKVYPEALKAVLAYSKAMGITADAAASKLGPALEGNTRALGSLKEAGIVLSASQRKTLQDMVEGGRVAEYQAKLLALLREKVGELSNEYDKNLSRQGERARIVLDDFGESIANQVIPAVEDLVNEIVNSLGGWDALKKTVNEVGGAIGNFIRTSIYGLTIALHELAIQLDVIKIGMTLFKKPWYSPVILPNPNVIKDFKKAQDEAAKSAAYHGQEIIRLSGLLGKHETALEGNNEVYKNNGSELDKIIGKNVELSRLTEELTDLYRDQTLELERIFALRMLATKGPFTNEERLAEEKKINEAHKDRILFLQQEEKFGTKVAESLAKQRKELKNLELKAKVELELATKLSPIKIDRNQVFRFADESLAQAVKRLDEIIAVEKANTEAFIRTTEDYENWISETAASWVDHFKSMEDVADREMFAVEEAVNRGLLSVAEGERAIAEIRANYYSAQIDQWSGFASSMAGMLSELGGSFGRFMSQIVQIAGSVQNVNQTANSLGGWSTAMGAFGGTVAAFVELYKFADSVIQKHKGEKYGTRGGISITGGTTVSSYTTQDSMGVTRAIEDVLRAFEDQLRISVTDLQAIEIRVRNNGKDIQAWVKGEWIGTFSDINRAIREALAVSLQDESTGLRGMSDLMSEGLARWTSPDMEGLLSFLTELREISDLSLSPLAIDLQKSFIHFNTLREALNKLDQSSQAVIKAQRELTEAQDYLYKQTRAQLLGIDLSAADAIRNLAGFQKGMADVSEMARTGLTSALEAAENRLRSLERTATGLPNGGMGGAGVAGPKAPGSDLVVLFVDGVTDAIDDEKSRLKASIEDLKKELSEIPKALSEQEINLGVFTAIEDDLRKLPQYSGLVLEMEKARVKAKYEELRLQLVVLGVWEQWAQVWQDIYNNALAQTGKPVNVGGGRGGGGSSNKDGVRDFIKDTKFELSLVGLTDYQKALRELNREYDEQIKLAGKDKKLKAELIALKEKELELLKKEQKEATRDKFREFMGLVTPFEKTRKTATDLIKEINGSPFGNAQKASMIGRVMNELERQLDNLSKSMAVDLFGKMLGDMERFGATDEQMRAAREAQAILQHELTMADYALRIAQLEAEGRVSAETLATLHDAYDFLAGIDPTKFIGNSGGKVPDSVANDNFASGSYSSTTNLFDEFENRLKSVQDKLAEWNRIPLSETLSRAVELTDSYAALLEDINKILPVQAGYHDLPIKAKAAFDKMVKGFINSTLGEFESAGSELENQLSDVADKFRDINAAFVHLGASQEDMLRLEKARLSEVQKVLSQWLDPIKDYRLGRLIGERSTLTGEQQFFAAQKQFRQMFSDIQAGDLTNLGDVVSLAEQYEELLRSYTGGEGLRFGLKEIDDALLKIETVVPDFASKITEMGTAGNPMIVDNREMIRAIEDNEKSVNSGNELMLVEMRAGVVEMRDQNTKLSNIEVVLSNPLNVKNVA